MCLIVLMGLSSKIWSSNTNPDIFHYFSWMSEHNFKNYVQASKNGKIQQFYSKNWHQILSSTLSTHFVRKWALFVVSWTSEHTLKVTIVTFVMTILPLTYVYSCMTQRFYLIFAHELVDECINITAKRYYSTPFC